MKRKKISISPGTFRVCSIFCRGLWAVERRLLPALPGVAAADLGGVHVNTIYPHIPLLTAACSITSAKVRGEEGVSCSYSCGTAGDFFKIAPTNKTEIIPSCSCSLHQNEKIKKTSDFFCSPSLITTDCPLVTLKYNYTIALNEGDVVTEAKTFLLTGLYR